MSEAEAAGAPSEGLLSAAERLSNAISDKAAAVGLGWKAEMDAAGEYLSAVKALRAALAAAPSVAPSESERAALFEAGRATGTVEGWADYTNAPGETADE